MSYKTDYSSKISFPLTMSVDITNNCNLRCLHCFNRSGNDLIRNELSDEEFINLAKEISENNLYTFCFCGGEPLLRYDLLLKMCDILSPHINNINMVSNGYLMTKEKALELKKHGMKHIQISIDGCSSKSHDYMRGVKGSYEKAINAVKAINSANLSVGIAFSPTSFNITEFPKVVENLNEISNLHSIRVQPLMSLGRASLNSILPTENQYRELVNFIDKYNSQNLSFPKKIEWGDPIDHLIRYPELLDATLHGHINSDGSLTASVYLPIILGNIRNHSFKEYWNSGLNRAFKIPFIHDLSQNITSISELGTSSENFPKLFFAENITVDLIDDDIFNNLNKFKLSNLKGGVFVDNTFK